MKPVKMTQATKNAIKRGCMRQRRRHLGRRVDQELSSTLMQIFGKPEKGVSELNYN